MLLKKDLTIEILTKEASVFSEIESKHEEPRLYGITDGKAVGTYLEHKFKAYLANTYNYEAGNSASGIDFPELNIDMKVTSIKQPQSSCPFKSARQKIYGLGYNLLVFIYDKLDNSITQTGKLNMQYTIFINKKQTADFQTTKGILEILDREGNADDLVAFLQDKNLPIDEIEIYNLVEEILRNRPLQGYLTISNALQWRLQYGRVIQKAGEVEGISKIR